MEIYNKSDPEKEGVLGLRVLGCWLNIGAHVGGVLDAKACQKPKRQKRETVCLNL